MDWRELLLIDYAYIYSLSLVIWRFLEGKLRNVKAFALAYVTGAHLVVFTLSLVLGLPYLSIAVILSYSTSVALALKRPEVCAEPYLYLFWATLFALLMVLR